MRIKGFLRKFEKVFVNRSIEPGSFTPSNRFDDIPGPKGLPLIGNVFSFLPYIGKYGNGSLLNVLKMLRDDHGNIVRLTGILNRRPTVFLFTPELCEKMYRQQGVWPLRIAMETLQYYRESRRNIYGNQYGLTSSQGKDWHDFRSKVNQHMMRPRVVKPHVADIDKITAELIGIMREMRNEETKELPKSFNSLLNKWALEATASIALATRLGCMDPNLAKNSDAGTMINAVGEMFELLYKLEIEPSMWKIYATPNLRKLFRVLDTLNGVAIKYVERAKKNLVEKSEHASSESSILEKLLRVDEQTAKVMAIDMLTAGVDTTANTSASLLYYLATNPSKQQKLREESKRVLPSKASELTSEALINVPYTRACIKEALRLFPIVIGTLRTMPTNIILDGYEIPKGCDVIACHALMSRDPDEFPEPEAFIPERWLRNENNSLQKEAHPFAYMPFGFGARTCVGRRFAELAMEVLALKVIRNFRIEWHHSPIECSSRFINTVSSPLQLKLVEL